MLKIMSRKRKNIDTDSYAGKFALRLRSLREKKGLTVKQLAEKSGIPEQTIYNWEGALRQPSLDTFPTLANALEVKVQKLLPE